MSTIRQQKRHLYRQRVSQRKKEIRIAKALIEERLENDKKEELKEVEMKKRISLFNVLPTHGRYFVVCGVSEGGACCVCKHDVWCLYIGHATFGLHHNLSSLHWSADDSYFVCHSCWKFMRTLSARFWTTNMYGSQDYGCGIDVPQSFNDNEDDDLYYLGENWGDLRFPEDPEEILSLEYRLRKGKI